MPEFIYKRPVEELAPLKPIVTAFLLLICLGAYMQSISNTMSVTQQYSFTGFRFADYMDKHDYLKLLMMMFTASFTQAGVSSKGLLNFVLNMSQMAFSMYFIWVFGSLVEIRLGYMRYLTVLILSMIAGYFMLGFEVGPASTAHFVGPALLTAGIVGAYLNFLPEKKFEQGGTIGRSYKVVMTEASADPSKAFTVSPWKLFAAFFAWQLAAHYLIYPNIPGSFDNMRLVSLGGTVVAGLGISVIVIMIATANSQGHPLQRLAILQYHELRKIDLTHEQAITGSARLLSLPDDAVRTWVQTAKSSLPEPPKG